MKASRALSIAALAVASWGMSDAHAALTVDYSDQWWTPAESGWGASVQQQAEVLLVDLMVYGPDGRPAWFVAAASPVTGALPGHDVFEGDLYSTTYSASTGFDPSKVASRRVGTLRFDASGVNSAVLAYTVDGVWATKNVVRQTWGRDEPRLGEYRGYWWNRGCSHPAFDWEPSKIIVSRDGDGRLVLSISCPWCWGDFYHVMRGTYSREGHLGRLVAEMTGSDTGTVTLSGIEWNEAGFTAGLSGTIATPDATCEIHDGRVGAIAMP